MTTTIISQAPSSPSLIPSNIIPRGQSNIDANTSAINDGNGGVGANSGLTNKTLISGHQSQQSESVSGSGPTVGANSIMASIKQCGIGSYLCYKEDALGTLYQHWSDNTPKNGAILYLQPGEGVQVPAFKFKQNSGRIELSQNVNQGLQYYLVTARFLKELIFNPKYQCSKITLLAHTEYVPLQLVFLKKGNGQVFYLKESGKSIIFNPSEIAAIGVVPYNDTSFLVMTMDAKLFVEKCSKIGGVATPV